MIELRQLQAGTELATALLLTEVQARVRRDGSEMLRLKLADRGEIGPGHIERLRERALGGLGSSRPGRARAGLVLPACEPGHGATLVCRFVGGAGSVRPMCL